MIRETEVLSSVEVERHLNHNPRVIEYRGKDVLVVKYDASKPISRIVGAEAKALGLTEIGGRPYNA
jgi:hypothetical protein